MTAGERKNDPELDELERQLKADAEERGTNWGFWGILGGVVLLIRFLVRAFSD